MGRLKLVRIVPARKLRPIGSLLFVGISLWAFSKNLFPEVFPQDIPNYTRHNVYSNRYLHNPAVKHKENYSVPTKRPVQPDDYIYLHKPVVKHEENHTVLTKSPVRPEDYEWVIYEDGNAGIEYPHRVKKRHSDSYKLWMNIKVHPVYKTGKAKWRYGEKLQLYSTLLTGGVPQQSNKIDQVFSFAAKANGLVDCKQLFLRGRIVSNRTQEIAKSALKHRFEKILLTANKSCEKFKHKSGYVISPLTSEEAAFPIAFSIVIFKDVEQFEILLRSIYRPQNVYCVHIDKKSPDVFRQTVEELVRCFDNVFVASTSIDVKWGTFSVLEPDIICARELFQHKTKWKYFINLTGQEMPLRTNYELVKVLKAFNGANNVESSRMSLSRIKGSDPFPYGVTPIKGAVHVILSRAFVDFMLHNETALAIYEWSKTVGHASEVFFSTLNFNPKLAAPGSYKGLSRTSSDENRFLVRLKNWGGESFCSGKRRRNICILSPPELPLMATREELFANKLHFNYHPEMQVCMPELLFNRTVDEYNGLLLFNDSYYKTRDFVLNRF